MVTLTTNTTTKRIVTLANAAPDEIVQRAQLMIKTAETWHILAAGQRVHGDGIQYPAPAVACPIVDISNVTDDEKVAELMRLCTLPTAGVIAMQTLIDGLVQLGGKVVIQ
jgi:hypothetical protein